MTSRIVHELVGGVPSSKETNPLFDILTDVQKTTRAKELKEHESTLRRVESSQSAKEQSEFSKSLENLRAENQARARKAEWAHATAEAQKTGQAKLDAVRQFLGGVDYPATPERSVTTPQGTFVSPGSEAYRSPVSGPFAPEAAETVQSMATAHLTDYLKKRSLSEGRESDLYTKGLQELMGTVGPEHVAQAKDLARLMQAADPTSTGPFALDRQFLSLVKPWSMTREEFFKVYQSAATKWTSFQRAVDLQRNLLSSRQALRTQIDATKLKIAETMEGIRARTEARGDVKEKRLQLQALSQSAQRQITEAHQQLTLISYRLVDITLPEAQKRELQQEATHWNLMIDSARENLFKINAAMAGVSEEPSLQLDPRVDLAVERAKKNVLLRLFPGKTLDQLTSEEKEQARQAVADELKRQKINVKP